MAKEDYVNSFLKKLQEQAASSEKQLTREDEDRKIKNTIRSWWKKETPAYDHFKYHSQGEPKTDIQYFAHHLKKGGIGLKEGWEYAKETLRGYVDAEFMVDGEEYHQEFIDEYNRTAYNQKFRDKIVNYGIK